MDTKWGSSTPPPSLTPRSGSANDDVSNWLHNTFSLTRQDTHNQPEIFDRLISVEFANGSFLEPCLGIVSLNYDLFVFISMKMLFKTWLKSMADNYSELFS